MSGALDSALILAQLRPENRAKFLFACTACGAEPKQWCEGRRGTIDSKRGEEFPNELQSVKVLIETGRNSEADVIASAANAKGAL